MQERLLYLFNQYIERKANPSELEEFYRIVQQGNHDLFLHDLIGASFTRTDDLKEESCYLPGAEQRMLQTFFPTLPHQVRVRRVKQIRLKYVLVLAAVVGLFVVGGAWFYQSRLSGRISTGGTHITRIIPGKFGATLTLGTGEEIRLGEVPNGHLAAQPGVLITKTAAGQLVYEQRPASGSVPQMNTLSTAKGQTYQLRLPDGSVVYLNADSRLRYSSSLISLGKRVVELQGEGYFEIAKDAAHPFVVKTDDQEVSVLGTHFNISNYPEENKTRTTLLEGLVQISPFLGKTVLLLPDQQAETTDAGLYITKVNASDAVAWKNGYFMFNNEDLESVMQRLARWYAVKVIFEDEEARGGNYFGTISRYQQISQVLNMLSKTDLIRFKIEDNTIRISKKKINNRFIKPNPKIIMKKDQKRIP